MAIFMVSIGQILTNDLDIWSLCDTTAGGKKHILSTQNPFASNSLPGGQTHLLVVGSRTRPLELSQTQRPLLSTMKPRSAGHGMQFPFSSKA